MKSDKKNATKRRVAWKTVKGRLAIYNLVYSLLSNLTTTKIQHIYIDSCI
jgi:hypothetical protein